MGDSKRELKFEKSMPYLYPPLPLKAEAFKRATELKETAQDFAAASDPRIKQLLMIAEAKFMKKEVQEEKVFENYRLLHTKEHAWIEDKKGEVIFFEDLSAAEKMQYFIYSTISTGLPDRFHWEKSVPSLFQIFQDKKDFAALVNALKINNQWEKQAGLLNLILHERPPYFIYLFEAVGDAATKSKICDLLNISFAWLQLNAQSYETMQNSQNLKSDVEQHAQFKKFQDDYKLDLAVAPIPYSELIKIAKVAKPEDQVVFKMYLQRYYPAEFQKTITQEKSDFAKAFLAAHQQDIQGLDEKRQTRRLYVQNGDLKALQGMKIEEIYHLIPWMHRCQHRDLLNYFYKLAINTQPSPYKAPPLYWMVAFDQSPKENKEIEVLLAERDLNVNKATDDGETPLHMAAKLGLTSWIKTLSEFKSINIDAKMATRATPLYLAAREGRLDAVGLLFEKGAGVDQRMSDGTSPLFMAAQNGHLEVVRLLLEKGASVTPSRNDEATPLFIAAQKGNSEIVRMLLKAGAKISKSSEGKTPFQVASNTGIKKLLLAAEINVELKKIMIPEGKEIQPTLFAYKNAELIQSIQKLQDFLNGNLSKNDFEELKPEFEKRLTTELWKKFFEEAVILSTLISGELTQRPERK